MKHANETASQSSHATPDRLLIAILRAALTESSLPEAVRSELDGTALPALYRLADTHDLSHIVSMRLSAEGLLGTGEVAEAFHRKEFLSILRTERMAFVYGELCDALDREGIPYIPLKGAVLRDHYPQPSMRTSADIDLFLHTEDLTRADRLLQSELSYRRTGEYFSEISYMTPGNVPVELHYYDERDTSDDFTVFASVWERCTLARGSRYTLQDADWLLYHINHMAKHVNHGGCGIRPFMDLWIMEHRMGLSRHCADEALKAHGLQVFAETAFALTDAWFDDGAHTELSRSLSLYLVDGGVYGSHDNAAAASRAAGDSRFRTFLRRVFPPYKQMCHMFPSLRRLPFLYPFYHVARWFRCLFRPNGLRHVTGTIKMDLSTAAERDERVAKLFRNLGLATPQSAPDSPSDRPSTNTQERK